MKKSKIGRDGKIKTSNAEFQTIRPISLLVRQQTHSQMQPHRLWLAAVYSGFILANAFFNSSGEALIIASLKP